MESVLAGDIGGTNARFVMFRDGRYEESSMRVLAVADKPDLADTIAAYLDVTQCGSIDKIALSVASTAEYKDDIELTNTDVRFKLSDLVARFELQQARVVNDFTAAALGVVNLPEEHLQLIHPGVTHDTTTAKQALLAPRAVLGPGTGLGVSGLIHSGKHWIPLQGQGGHVTMSVQTTRELAIRDELAILYKHVSAERYLSGPGLVGVYEAICKLDDRTVEFCTAQDISAAAVNADCETCSEVMQLFCKYLGIVAGDLAVTLGSTGGIYLAGGIVPSLGEYFNQSEFLHWLHFKGRFSEFVSDMPVWVVTGGQPALFGAYNSLQAHYDSYGFTVHRC